MFINKHFKIERYLQFLIKLFLFLLPWQTIYIVQERFLNAVKWESGTLGFYATEILLWLAVFLFIFWFWQKRKLEIGNWKLGFKFSKDRLFALSVLVFIIYLLLATLWAGNSSLALQQAVHIMEAFLLFFMLLLGPISFRELVKWLVAGAVLSALLGLLQFIWQTTVAVKWLGLAVHPAWQAGSSVVVGEGIGRLLRAYGSFNHPNVLGGYLFTAILGLTLLANFKIVNLKLKIVLLITYGLLLLALFLTFSRSALLALLIFLLSWLVYSLFSRYNLLSCSLASSGIVLLIILSTIFWPVVYNRMASNSVNEIQAVAERINGVEEAEQIFKQNKWLGVGPGNYTLATFNLNPERGGWLYQPVHNVGMLVLVELGMVGVLLLVFIFATYLLILPIKKYWFSFIILLLPLLVLSLFDHYLYSSYVGLMSSAVYGVLIIRFHTQELHS